MIVASLYPKDVSIKTHNTIKFLCSYGGKILPRYPDVKLRYVGGETRVLAVDRSIPFSDLLFKCGELCGSSVILRCQFPNEDLDTLVSITSDEDLVNLIEEYDQANQAKSAPLKIRAFLSSPKSIKKISPPPSATHSASFATNRCRSSAIVPSMAADRSFHQFSSAPFRVPVLFVKSDRSNLNYYNCVPHGNPRDVHVLHNGNHCQ